MERQICPKGHCSITMSGDSDDFGITMFGQVMLNCVLWYTFEPCHEKMWFLNRSDTNRSVQSQKMARSLKFSI